MKKTTRLILSAIITAVVGALAYYITLPPLNVFSPTFWLALAFMIVLFGGAYLVLGIKGGLMKILQGSHRTVKERMQNQNDQMKKQRSKKREMTMKVFVAIAAVPVAVLIIGYLISSTFFNATDYASIITVQEAVFEEDMPENDLVTNNSLDGFGIREYYRKPYLGRLVRGGVSVSGQRNLRSDQLSRNPEKGFYFGVRGFF